MCCLDCEDGSSQSSQATVPAHALLRVQEKGPERTEGRLWRGVGTRMVLDGVRMDVEGVMDIL